MNPAQLLAHFDRMGEAPDAIPRLRQFILELAVRGKLVGQDVKDEPASELLKRIVAEKLRRGRVERVKKAARTSFADTLFPLPMGWAWASLADLVAVLNGRAYSQNELLNAGTPVLRVGNLFTSKHWYYSNLELEEDKYCSDGDLIFAWSASFGPFIWQGPKVIYHYHIWKLELHSNRDLDKHYLYRFLLQKTEEIKSFGHGISMIHMTKEKMEKLQVPLPPLAEQHRIVAKVDELMALCDRLEKVQTERESRRDRLVASSLNRLNNGADLDPFQEHARFYFKHLPRLTTRPAHIKQLRQTILQLAVRGKLVPQNPNDESASGLLKRIQAVKAQQLKSGKLKKQQTLADTGKIEAPFEIPDSWCWGHMDDCFAVNGGIQKTPARTPKDNPYPYIGVANVYRGRLDLSEVKQFELLEGELERFRLVKGDILVVEGNGSPSEIGRCAMWSGEIEECVHQNHIIRCRPFILGFTPYALRFLNSPNGIEIMKTMAVTSSGLYSLSVGKIRTIAIPIPPLAEQHRIVAKVDELMALCDQLETQLTTTQTETRHLLEAVLQGALA